MHARLVEARSAQQVQRRPLLRALPRKQPRRRPREPRSLPPALPRVQQIRKI